ncbi:hypothetical protein Franean1_2611 [Parafrankia sp. EAN1pec]|uniref:HET-C-related protein n=1 Tax=Parafrankia sp. (strain EAN1pec) TaxID=298653 RepID=UPI0000542FA0|nr:hypothetical protein Franean1_2611 [Frankia sp. EAN1pec]
MNTAGHHAVGEEAGLPLLEAALAARAGKVAGLDAFILGNWLTDLSQTVDPVAYAGVKTKIQNKVDEYLRTITSNALVQQAGRFVPATTKAEAAKIVAEVRNRVFAALDVLLGAGPTDSGAAGAALHDAVVVLGYFKFVHPETDRDEPRIPLATYLTIVEAGFTQYFPHEHMDRPSVRPGDPPVYASDLDRGPRSEPDKVRGPDLYRYLRDDIEILAGGLAELDLDWARAIARGEIPTDGSDLRFPAGLARLGHLLHAVEDFFAHSNFIELFVSSQGGTYLPKLFEGRDVEIFARRLKRWSPGATATDWRTLPTENFVVTGYFGTWDTMVSLVHAAEELLGIGWQDPARRVGDVFRSVEMFERSKIEKEYYEWIESVSELLDDPAAAFENSNNRIAQKVAENWGDKVKTIKNPEVRATVLRQVMASTKFLKTVDPSITARIYNLVIAVTKGFAINSLVMSIRKSVDTLRKLFTVPLELIRDTAVASAGEFATESVLYLAKDLLLYNWILRGSDRNVGSHSLLAKDTGSEWLYQYQRACATAAHYIVLKNMMRHFDPTTAPPTNTVVDWLALLESLLTNPVGTTSQRLELKVTVPSEVSLPPQTRKVVDSIERTAKAAGVGERDGLPAWRQVAGATFGLDSETEMEAEQICRVIARNTQTEWRPRSQPATVEVLLPGLSVVVGSFVGRGNPETPWPSAVLERERSYPGKGWEVVRGYLDFAADQSVEAVVPPTRFVDERVARQRIQLSADRRRGAELRYNSFAK